MKVINLIGGMIISTMPLSVFSADSNSDRLSIEGEMQRRLDSITKMPLPLNRVPMTAFIVSQAEISRKGYRHLTDILKNTPGINTSNLATTEGAVTEVYVRGILANNKIVVLVDGIKIKSPMGEGITFFDTVPLLGLKQVEISLGSASSVYGADAMLATINLVTQDSEEIKGVQIKATGGTVDTGEVQLVAGTKIADDLSVMLSGSFHRSAKEDLAANYPALYGNVGAVDIKDQNYNVDFKLNYKDLTLQYYRLYSKNNTSISFNPSAPAFYDYSGAAFWENINHVANATYAYTIDPFWQSKTSLSYESDEVLPQSGYQGYKAPIVHYASLSEAIRFTQHVLYARDNISWLSGIELAFIKATPKHDVAAPPASIVHTSYQNYAVFSQLNYDWSDDLSLNGSVRLDIDSRFSPQFNPRVGFSWQALNPLRFFGAWGTSYLAPSPKRMYDSWSTATASLRQNPQLRPEKLHTSELGVDFMPTKNTQLKLSGFYTQGSNLIRLVQDPNKSGKQIVSHYDNVANSKTYGLQTIARQRFDNGLDLNLDYTLTLGRQNAEKINNGLVGITNTPRHMIKGNVEYSLENLTARFTGRWFGTVGTHESNKLYWGGNAPGALIFDSNLHYGGQLSTTKWSVDLGVDNLLDKKYYAILQNDGVGYALPRAPQETRKFYLTLGLSF